MRCISNGLPFFAVAVAAVAGAQASSFSGLVKRQVAEVQTTIGCNATGPLGGKWAVDVSPCIAGKTYTCEVTDSTGCGTYDSSNVEQLVATSLVTGPCQPLGGAASVSTTNFTCPQEAFAACTVTLNEDNGVSFGLKITAASES
ncbi:hypothetical protein SCHPADRAFT_900160 [Schizopora paradoxa]|uniref:Uncharacterized protein n=1 Tax=Schizopora paradoxa TaxID=27342 RepID=A0A0H2SLM9_9AGAM|nr:hypothetical protein SCHPADRAFT_900160 [Schizopora paradoxa]